MQDRPRFLMVIGSSGSGKSSLVKAGLLPRLKETKHFPRNTWRVLTMRADEARASAAGVLIGAGSTALANGNTFDAMHRFAEAIETLPDSSPLRGVMSPSLGFFAREVPRLESILEHAGMVNSAAFSRDGARVVTASGDKTARVWRFEALPGVASSLPLWVEVLTGTEMIGSVVQPLPRIDWEKRKDQLRAQDRQGGLASWFETPTAAIRLPTDPVKK
jgi:hypothetical protein